MEAALRLLDCAAPSTRRGQDVLELLRASARFKLTRAATMRFLMGEKSPFQTARAALRAEEKSLDEMTRLYGKTVALAELEFEMRVLFEGEMSALQGAALQRKNL
jgi:hypothetical protein